MAVPETVVARVLPTISVLGAPIHDVDMEQALDTIESFIHGGGPCHVVTADSSMLVTAQSDTALLDIICHADLVTPDSAGVLWAARRLGTPFRSRVSGVEIVERLCARSARSGWRLYFLGGEPGVAMEAARRMSAAYTGAQIVGAHHGFFSNTETDAVVASVRECKPDVLCVALGIPKQEKWIARYRDSLRVPVSIGVGGSLDVLSGRTRRAPEWMRRASLEWLWRLVSSPRKIRKVALLPRFVLMVRRRSRR